MLKTIMTMLMLCVVVGCGGPRYVDYFPYHDNGCAKPAVALLPVIDHSKSGLCWNLSDELTKDLYYEIMDQSELYLWPPKQVSAVSQSMENVDLMGRDCSFASRFSPAEFVAVVEIIEHDYVPYERGQMVNLHPIYGQICNTVLALKARVRMIDLRGEKPCIVLQEIVESNHMIARDSEKTNYEKKCWGSPAYGSTPVATAHQQLVRDLVCRLQSVAYTMR